ncbi:MAG: carboxypeptidase regulatory-like domain-containing protein [Myxococcales bacterium]|nr:carboxypeptidase regulatory-like domain-containing protein [Myxococcales bacterium]
MTSRARSWLILAAGASLLVAGAAILWPSPPPMVSLEPAPGQVPPAAELPDFQRVEVAAGEQKGLTLTGTVFDPLGRPVSGADVFLASSAQQSLTTVRCGECGELLLSCIAPESALTVAELLRRGRGLLAPAASTRSDEQGRFRFERLAGVSFTVWARSSGLGEAVRERAAPGEPVELFLPPLRTIAGRLEDERGRPVGQGAVRAVSRRLASLHEATSDARGYFEIRGLGEGPFFVLAEAEGYLPSVAWEVEAGPKPVHLTLAPARSLEVEVRSAGSPVDARVRLSGSHLSREAIAQGGLARFGGLYPDQLVVSATFKELSATPRVVTLDQPLTRVSLELSAGGVLHVSVVDEGGEPVPDPELALATHEGEVVQKRKGRQGEVQSFGPLGEGDYLLRGSANGFKPSELPVSLRAGSQSVELTLERGTVISGRVLDEYGRPAPGISILVTPTGDSVLADGEGRFTAQVPSPGLYQLHAHHSDWGGGLLQVTAPARGVELHLEPRAGAHVTVLAEGRRVEGAHVVLFIEREGSFRSDRPSGSDGVVLMRGMPAGTYWLVASHAEYLPSERQKLSIGEGQLVRVTAELRAGASVFGEVVDTHGAPVPTVALSVVPRGAEPTVSDGVGRFEIRALRPGLTYRVEARHPRFEQQDRVLAQAGGPPARVVLKRRDLFRGRVLSEDGTPLKRFRVDDHAVDSADGRFELPLSSIEDRVIFVVQAPGHEPLMVDQPATPDLGNLYLKRAPELTGVVRESSGIPVTDAVVSCDVCEESVLSGADGRFRLSRPPYVAAFLVLARKGRLFGSRQVSAGTGGPIELRLVPAVRLSGAAYLPEGRPAAGVEIEGVNLERSEPVSAVTSQEGRYSMEVAEGNYRFTLGAGPAGQLPRHGEATAVVAEVRGAEAVLNLGPAPGTASLAVRLRPMPGYALWAVRGELAQVGNPPIELFRAPFALLRYQPPALVTLQGLTPGRYSLVYSAFHTETPSGPLVLLVDVPAQGEIVLAK